MRNSAPRRAAIGAGAALALITLRPSATSAHDIPTSVAIIAYARPQGNVFHMIVRVPLESMRDMVWPVRPPGYLELTTLEPILRDAARQWIADEIALFEGDTQLGAPVITGVRVSLPSDRAFESYESAARHVRGPPLDSATDLAWQQAMFDVSLEFAIASDTSRFSIDPKLGRLGVRTTTVLHFLAPGHGERVFQYHGDPGRVQLDPRWHQAALSFVKLGFEHILGGIDHLLFVLCLVIPIRRLGPLIGIVTAFTVAHSITLIAAAKGFAPGALWFPPLVETLIAASILYMALENIVGARVERRWMIAFCFGLIHGFGFSFALSDSLQFAGAHLLTALFTFNIGVELGQILVLLIALPLLSLLFRKVVSARMGTIILSAFVAHTAWHWMTERGAAVAEYDMSLPAFDVAFVIQTMRLLMILLILAGGLWMTELVVRRRGEARSEKGSSEKPGGRIEKREPREV